MIYNGGFKPWTTPTTRLNWIWVPINMGTPILIQTATGVAAPVFRVIKSATDVALDTTIANDIRVTYKWGAALTSNILRADIFKVTKERVNI